MTTIEKIESILHAHFLGDDEQVRTIALQVAAHEAHQGHGELAHNIRHMVDQARHKQIQNVNFPSDLDGLLLSEEPNIPKSSLVIVNEVSERIQRIIHEYRQREQLKQHALTHRRKILLVGPPGTGKTMTAKVLAHELRLPLYTVLVDRMVTKFVRETSARLQQILNIIPQKLGIYLFEAIGGARTLDSDGREMRQVLNVFHQFIKQDTSDSLIIAETNSIKLISQDLFRCFDDVIYYSLPTGDGRKHLIQNVLGSYCSQDFSWEPVIAASETFSHADIVRVCHNAIKTTLLTNGCEVDECLMSIMVNEWKAALKWPGLNQTTKGNK